MDRDVPSTQKNLEGLVSVERLRPRFIPQFVVRNTVVLINILNRLSSSLKQNGAGAVALRSSR